MFKKKITFLRIIKRIEHLEKTKIKGIKYKDTSYSIDEMTKIFNELYISHFWINVVISKVENGIAIIELEMSDETDREDIKARIAICRPITDSVRMDKLMRKIKKRNEKAFKKSDSITLTLIGTNPELVNAWRKEFSSHKEVKILDGSIFEHPTEAIVSPANSFGIMDGGLDGKLRDYFGMEIEKKVRKRINEDYNGELLVGQAILTKTGNSQFPFLITAPTMRVPQNIANSINAYLAMKAILIVAKQNKIHYIICPGLGSLSGKMNLDVVARQMRVAYEQVVFFKYDYSHWREEKDMEKYMKCEIDYPPIDLEKRMY